MDEIENNILNINNFFNKVNSIEKNELDKFKLSNNYNIKKIKKLKILNIAKLFCNSTNISENTLGQIIRAFHTTSPFAALSCILFFDLPYVVLSTLFLITILLLFRYYNGCILSYLENKLCNDNYNITDIILEVTQLEKNHNNRVHITYFIGSFYGVLYILILIYRLCF